LVIGKINTHLNGRAKKSLFQSIHWVYLYLLLLQLIKGGTLYSIKNNLMFLDIRPLKKLFFKTTRIYYIPIACFFYRCFNYYFKSVTQGTSYFLNLMQL